ncbi:unnamed protein product [Scytosiphon promiscuus]
MPPQSVPARGITSQPSVSMNLLRADTIAAGTEIWTEDEDEVWMLAEVLRQENTRLSVRRKSTGEELQIDLGFTETFPTNPKVVSDMTSLHHIHEAGILYDLAERSKLRNQRPYTFMGTILIAVNPLRRLPEPEMGDYMDHSLDPEAPHPYAIAELAYRQMRLGAGRKVANQSIVVSGESGAGKTETSKIILNFLTHRSVGGVASLDQKVVDTSPILESFGNAKTLRNNNSSRFGKFLKLQFTKDKYCLAGAFVETYLLEKSRVLTQGTGERNFHILYQLVAGTSDLDADLKLEGGADEFKILSQSECTTLDDVDDAEEFRTVKAAFDTIGMDANLFSIHTVWEMLASVLHMSNLEYEEVDHEQGAIASISDREALSRLSTFLGVEEGALEEMLTQRVVVTRGETFTKQLGLEDANLTRNAIVKSLYEALFLWVVAVINTSLGKGADSLPFIGVLDIFGFENFDTKNEFEQLLINFTNESLQDTFNKQVFNNELKLYEDEGIDVVVSSCPDNAECLKLLSGKPKGIIPSLDNVCAEPNPSDSRYLSALHKEHAKHEDFPRTQPRDVRENFWVKHYAGKVKYTVEGWVERNMDRIPESFSGTLGASTHKVVKEATAAYGKAPAGASGGAKAKPTRVRKTLVKPTVAKAFLGSMQDLNVTLLSTTCNFARCIKPNGQMECGVFDNRYVVDQLQCLGILQTCEVLKVGMPTRVTYTELKEVLGANAEEAEKLFEGEPETALIAAILWAFEVPSEVFRLGRTRVFFRAGQISTLQKILNETGPEKGPWIFKRLEEALANRHKAKAAAEEAKAAIAEVEPRVTEAQEETTKAIGAEESDGEGGTAVRAPPKPVLGGDEKYELESAMKKARKAGGCIPQVEQFIRAAKEDEIGKYAEGAMERVMTASEETRKTITASSTIANELDAAIRTAVGGDAAGEIRRLEDSLKRLRSSFQEAKELAVGSEEAAAKCQATGAVSKAAKGIAESAKRQKEALGEAKALLPGAVAATDAALAALSSFQTLVSEASDEETRGLWFRTGVEGGGLFRRSTSPGKHLRNSDAEVSHDPPVEPNNRKRYPAKFINSGARLFVSACETTMLPRGHRWKSVPNQGWGEVEAPALEKCVSCVPMGRVPRWAVAIACSLALHHVLSSIEFRGWPNPNAVKTVLLKSAVFHFPFPCHQNLSLEGGHSDDKLSSLRPSQAPGRGMRGQVLKRQASQSVKDLLDTVVKPDMSVSPKTEEGDSRYFDDIRATDGALEHQQSFQAKFRQAMEGGFMEGHLMRQISTSTMWKSSFFRLEDDLFTCYETKSLVGTRNFKRMELVADSTTSYTNYPNCFCVQSGKEKWVLLAKDEPSMQRWMTAINGQIHRMFIKRYNVPEDNYWSQGLKGRFFYRMVPDVLPQWIRSVPEEAAPRTGDGLFPGEVIEIVQVISNKETKKVFLRLADDRGWTYAEDPQDGSVLFEEIGGAFIEEAMDYRAARGEVPILTGPSLESQMTGLAVYPEEVAEALARFVPTDEASVEFIKLAEAGGGKRGWLPISEAFGVIPAGL